MKKTLVFLFSWLTIVLLFFFPLLNGKSPAPLDTIVGLYNPWRDNVWDGFSAGVPFKNFLITDPVRQQIPYKFLAIENLKKGNLTYRNPYSFSGTPLSSNIQSSSYYPLNFIFLIFPFLTAWTISIILNPLLGGIFIFLYLKYLKMNNISSFFGALVFSFSGFMISWLEWETITNVLIWLPLILFAQDNLLNKISLKWALILIFSEVSQLLAGHLQISFYVLIFTTLYLIIKIIYGSKSGILTSFRKYGKRIIFFLVLSSLIIILCLFQYLQLIRFVVLSARNYDLSWVNPGWFLPYQNLVQLLIPDFFGNPSTLNYWGIWNYGEFISYIGILPLIFSFYAIFISRRKITSFYSASLLTILILVTKNPISKIPYSLNIPFYASAQPSRLISLMVFCLSVLSAIGFNHFIMISDKRNKIIYIISTLFLIFFLIGLLIFLPNVFSYEIMNNLKSISLRNLYLPISTLTLSSLLLLIFIKFKKPLIIYVLVILTIFDLFRFGRKYVSFSPNEWFFPNTKSIEYLRAQKKPFRIMTTDRRIMPPNFSIMYKLEDVSGYDPIYLLNYAKLVQAWTSGIPSIKVGNFNRILNPTDYNSFITDLLNVKYVLSFDEINSEKLVKKYQEGETKIYENLSAFPRAYLVNGIQKVNNEEEEIELMYSLKEGLLYKAIVTEDVRIESTPLEDGEMVRIENFDENKISLRSNTNMDRFMVLSEIYYPAWKAKIDFKSVEVYKTDLSLIGIVIPKGEHIIDFYYSEY